MDNEETRGEIIRIASENLYHLRRYRKDDGSFDYEKYRNIQTAGNVRKLNNVWAVEENIIFLSQYIVKMIGQPQFGLCHGTRRGLEQGWFRDHLGCQVMGTEISPTASDFDNTLHWDFHEHRADWAEKADFVYSNSFDHSYDPRACIHTWVDSLRPGGLCIIEHSSAHEEEGVSELDPFGCNLLVMPFLLAIWSEGKYAIREIISAPVKKSGLAWNWFIVIQKIAC